MTSSVIKNRAGESIDYFFHASNRRDTLVILGHGVTGNKDRPLLVALAEGLAERGWPCMRISFSGNGASEGKFGEATLSKGCDDLHAVLDNVPDWVRVVYVGHSMGAAAGVLTAARDLRIRVLVSLAGMTYPGAFVEREFGGVTPGHGFMWDDPDRPLSEGFVADLKAIDDLVPTAATVTQPWLLIHGAVDEVVPVADGRDAFAAAPGKKKWIEIPTAGHLFDDSTYPQVIECVDAWLTAQFGE